MIYFENFKLWNFVFKRFLRLKPAETLPHKNRFNNAESIVATVFLIYIKKFTKKSLNADTETRMYCIGKQGLIYFEIYDILCFLFQQLN